MAQPIAFVFETNIELRRVFATESECSAFAEKLAAALMADPAFNGSQWSNSITELTKVVTDSNG